MRGGVVGTPPAWFSEIVGSCLDTAPMTRKISMFGSLEERLHSTQLDAAAAAHVWVDDSTAALVVDRRKIGPGCWEGLVVGVVDGRVTVSWVPGERIRRASTPDRGGTVGGGG